ncbi:MAG: hypothetical protein EXR53_02425 [Dehalococcoidia bacterium]|nr:hypothetical protein [Dehalococcoidia bacterium]
MANLADFWNRLSKGPAILFLGQDYFKVESGNDPLLIEIQNKFGGSMTSGPHYDLLLESTAKQSGDAALAW